MGTVHYISEYTRTSGLLWPEFRNSRTGKRVRAAWRVGSVPAVVEFRLLTADDCPQMNSVRTPESEESPRQKRATLPDKLREKFDCIREEIDRITTEYDQYHCDSLSDYGYEDCISDKEVLRNFRENYSIPSIGKLRGDDTTAEQWMSLIPKVHLLQLVRKHSVMQACDYYIQHDEMGSIHVGETEHQIDVPDHKMLSALIGKCTDEEFAVYRELYGRIDRECFSAFGNPCERAILKLDAVAFVRDAARKYLPRTRRAPTSKRRNRRARA
jgi:hypothetical protein